MSYYTKVEKNIIRFFIQIFPGLYYMVDFFI